jgi:hypothetical protein
LWHGSPAHRRNLRSLRAKLSGASGKCLATSPDLARSGRQRVCEGHADDPPGARLGRGRGGAAGAHDALAHARCGAGAPCPDRAARGRWPGRAGDRGQDGPVRGHGPLLAQALQRAWLGRAGGGHALGAAAHLHGRGAQCSHHRRPEPAL